MKEVPRRTITLLLAASITLLAGSSHPAQAGREFREAEVDAVFAEHNKSDSPGCALGAIQDGDLIYARGYGMASLEHGVPITPDTVFRIGSVSKQFTAAAMALLAEEGAISLDDDLREHLPEIPAYERPITIRHLIHHTSGLRDYTDLAVLAGIDTVDHYTAAESLSLIARQRGTDFPPGNEYSYSNSGYFLLSQILERATGKTLRAYAEKRIFKPLGMKRTHFHDDLNEIIPRRAYGYSPTDDGGFRIDMTSWEQVGDGSIFTTIEDLLLWDRNFYENRLGRGGPKLIETLQTRGVLNDGKAIDYAFGLRVDAHRGLKRVSHGGSWVGFRAHLTRFPEQRFSVAVLCNLSTASPGVLAQRVADIYLAGEFKERAEESGAGDPSRTRGRVKVPESDLRRVVGHYWNASDKMARRIDIEDGRLLYRRGTDDATPLIPLGGGRFKMEDAEAEVRFPESKEEPRTMIVTVEGSDPVHFEAFEPVSPSIETLRAYEGTYYCEELDARYDVGLKDDQLVASVGHLRDRLLTPLFPDLFQHQGWVTFTFDRDASGRVGGFAMDTGRIRNLRCSRRPE